MEPWEVLIVMLIGMLSGAFGQVVRFAAGSTPRAGARWQPKPFFAGLATAVVIGAAAGGLGAVTFLGDKITTQDLVELVVIGYVGTDFFEQFVKTMYPGAKIQ